MACGCRGRNIEYASNEDFYNKVKKIAKGMATDEGVWYVVFKCSNGSYDFMREENFNNESGVAYVEHISPV